jgi:hypothetical protein
MQTIYQAGKDRGVNNPGELSLSNVIKIFPDSEKIRLHNSKLIVTIGDIKALMKLWKNMTPDDFIALPVREQRAIEHRIKIKLEHEFKQRYPDEWKKACGGRIDESSSALERTRIHKEILRPWALRGPLILEKPQASSLHHLREYCTDHNKDLPKETTSDGLFNEQLQSIVVENDWAKLVPPATTGDQWRTPYKYTCWEFRISGIRVLTFVEVREDYTIFTTVYGTCDHWIVDDYLFWIDNGSNITKISLIEPRQENPVSFDRVYEKIAAEIRASCIMLDARMTEEEIVLPSPKLIERARKEKRRPPIQYRVVRLMKQHKTQRIARSVIGTGKGTSQRGHWRRGNYFYYDDPDSGKEQIVNSGGFWISRTWRSWYFAGDPNNIIEKEYRL